ncbi:hypothetical protein [Burkholderia sp. Bp8998]|uniref:hypothetical protein n=1 Tax=Burkholderia sp. Bp8998 TaxID=2184557 RepID=UPI000F5A9EBB|nr:hypothetical protein [Burkholderia sp. Bp8998]RQS04898.1 hypothetical protein DIE06_37165 [Burkholderia sp. Bp8998]
MDLRTIGLCFAAVVLMATSFIYGIKFLKKRNYLIGLEWWVVTVSATNLLIYFSSGAQISYHISYFLDAFSRGFGIPVIATAGLLVLTHGYKPSLLADILFFVAGFVVAAILMSADFVMKVKPYLYVVMFAGFSIYLAYFIKRLVIAGEKLHALGMAVGLVTCQTIASIYDFYKIPGEETNVVFNFLFLALLTWSYFATELYYAYCALERAEHARRIVVARKT